MAHQPIPTALAARRMASGCFRNTCTLILGLKEQHVLSFHAAVSVMKMWRVGSAGFHPFPGDTVG